MPDRNPGRCRLSRAVDDAVYLDEDAYHQVQPKVAYLKTIQVHSDVPAHEAAARIALTACMTQSRPA